MSHHCPMPTSSPDAAEPHHTAAALQRLDRKRLAIRFGLLALNAALAAWLWLNYAPGLWPLGLYLGLCGVYGAGLAFYSHRPDGETKLLQGRVLFAVEILVLPLVAGEPACWLAAPIVLLIWSDFLVREWHDWAVEQNTHPAEPEPARNDAPAN